MVICFCFFLLSRRLFLFRMEQEGDNVNVFVYSGCSVRRNRVHYVVTHQSGHVLSSGQEYWAGTNTSTSLIELNLRSALPHSSISNTFPFEWINPVIKYWDLFHPCWMNQRFWSIMQFQVQYSIFLKYSENILSKTLFNCYGYCLNVWTLKCSGHLWDDPAFYHHRLLRGR